MKTIKQTTMTIGMIAMATALVACESELDGKTAATVGEAQAVEQHTDDDDTVEIRELTFDTEESSIGWVGNKVTGDHTGGFEVWDGAAKLRDGELSELSFTVDTTSVFSDNEDLTEHLKSEDFFAVGEYPEASFEATNITESDADGATHEVTGNFTIRGVTKSVTFPANVNIDDDGLRASTEFTIQRFDFGIEYKGKADNLIADEVLLKIDLAAS